MSREFTIHPRRIGAHEDADALTGEGKTTAKPTQRPPRGTTKRGRGKHWSYRTQVPLRNKPCFGCQQLGLPVTTIRRW